MQLNAVSLTGQIAEAEPLRHTPAGLPLLTFRLLHQSLQMEAGHRRHVECEVTCIALAEMALELSRARPRANVKIAGFLNRRNRMSRQLVLHATSSEIIDQ